MAQHLFIGSTVGTQFPAFPYRACVRAILGGDFMLSLTAIGDRRGRRLNETLRHKIYIPNILTFALSKTEGDMYLNLSRARHEARRIGISERDRVALLVIHGCLHLKGVTHGVTMEDAERLWCKKFRVAYPQEIPAPTLRVHHVKTKTHSRRH